MHPGAALYATLLGEFRRDFNPGTRHLFTNSLRSISHVALMKVFEYPPVIQMQVEFLISRVSRSRHSQGEQPGLAAGHAEFFCVENTLFIPVSRDCPSQAFISLH